MGEVELTGIDPNGRRANAAARQNGIVSASDALSVGEYVFGWEGLQLAAIVGSYALLDFPIPASISDRWLACRDSSNTSASRARSSADRDRACCPRSESDAAIAVTPEYRPVYLTLAQPRHAT